MFKLSQDTKLLILYIVVGVLLINLYWYFSKFKRRITIAKISAFGSHKIQPRILNLMMDEKGRIYELHDSLPLLHITSANIFMQLNEGETYDIEGYGFKIPGTDIYPNILTIKPVN